jgi:peptidoglycan/xylan/chitin deacetylase (PgdA/CDA1 family)
VVLTFDDGFRDNLIHGLPLLERYGVPATVFVVTRCITTGELPWPQRLGCLFQNTDREHLSASGEDSGSVILKTASDRRRACMEVKERLARLPRSHRDKEIDRLAEALGVTPPMDRMLSWADLEEMQGRGVEIGAHTYSHPHLARMTLDEARSEMQRSMDDLRERLGIERPFFCFPAGSVSSGLVDLAREIGFRGCFRSSRGRRYNHLGTSDRFGLSRLGLPNNPGYVLEAEIDGPFHHLRSLYRS